MTAWIKHDNYQDYAVGTDVYRINNYPSGLHTLIRFDKHNASMDLGVFATIGAAIRIVDEIVRHAGVDHVEVG